MSSADRSDDQQLRQSAESGDSYSQYRLGLAYGNESDPGYDLVKSAEWLGRAARSGLSLAQVEYGVCHYYGNGVGKNHREALRWYYAAFLQLGPNSAYNIADLYDDSDEFPKNPIEAAAFFSLSLGGNNDARQRLEAILPLLGHNDLARVVARAAMLHVLPASKAGLDSISLAPGLSLEPPDGPEPDDTPVTMLALLVRLYAVLDDKYHRELLLNELGKGKSTLYGACHVVNPCKHEGAEYQSYRPAFTMELEGIQTAVLFTSQRNFRSCNPVPDALPMGMPCSTYLEMITKMELGALRIDPGCFGDITLRASELPQPEADEPGETVDKSQEVSSGLDLPDPPPFKAMFRDSGSDYLVEFFPRTLNEAQTDAEGRLIVTFAPGGTVLKVQKDGVPQANPADFETKILGHLNSAKGLRDGDFSDMGQLEEPVFMARVMTHFVRMLRLAGISEWEVAEGTARFGFLAKERGGQRREVLLNFRPRSKGQLGLVAARLRIPECDIKVIGEFLKDEREAAADIFARYKVNPNVGYETPKAREDFDVSANKWREAPDDDPAAGFLLVVHMESGISPMDEPGAERYAAGLLRLQLAMLDLHQHAKRRDVGKN